MTFRATSAIAKVAPIITDYPFMDNSVEIIIKYTDNTNLDYEFPHDIKISGLVTLTNADMAIYQRSWISEIILRYVEENFGEPHDGNELDLRQVKTKRWSLWNWALLDIGFRNKADATAFVLWIRGKTVEDLLTYYK